MKKNFTVAVAVSIGAQIRFCRDGESDHLFVFDATPLFQLFSDFWREETISKNTNHIKPKIKC